MQATRFLIPPRAAALRLAALDALRDGALDVVVRDPALVIVLVGTGSGAGRLVTGQGLDIDLLALLGSRLGAARLREERLDPSLVDQVESTTEDSSQEDVEEDARKC